MTTGSPHTEALAYFATPGVFSDLAAHAAGARELPSALTDLCCIVQGLVIHPFLAHLYWWRAMPGSAAAAEARIRNASVSWIFAACGSCAATSCAISQRMRSASCCHGTVGA